MKKIAAFIFLSTLLLAGCEKETGDPYIMKFYGDAFEDIGYSVAIAPDGYIVAGQLESISRVNGVIDETTANKNMAVIKTDWNGNIVWKTTIGGSKSDFGSKIYQLGDNSLICVGTLDDTTASNYKKEVFAVKLSATGQVLWKKAYGGAGNQQGVDVVETSYGFMILGMTDVARPPIGDSTGNNDGNSDIYLLKINGNGDYIYSFGTGYSGNDYPSAIKVEPGDNCVVLGTTDQSWTGMSQSNFLILEVLPSGTGTGATRIIGSADDEYASDMEIVSDGYLLAGTVGSKGTDQQAVVVRVKKSFALSGAITYTKKFKISDASTAVNSIAPFGGANFVLAGHSGVYPSTRILVFEMDPDGNLPAGKQMIRGSSGEQTAYDVVSADDGYVIAVGKNKYEINSMISFLKFKF